MPPQSTDGHSPTAADQALPEFLGIHARSRGVPDTPLISVAQAGRLMGISESKAYELAREGNLPGLVSLPGHRRLVRRAVLEAWLTGQPVDVTPHVAPAPPRRAA